MAGIIKTYHWMLTDLADPRVQDWPLMQSPLPTVFMLAAYLYLIKIKLPNYMKNRRAYDLKDIIYYYNIVQIVANALLFLGTLTSGWLTTYHFGCMPQDFSTGPEPMRMMSMMWWAYILKIVDLCDTVFFILRKKDNQASFLHVFHHGANMSISWLNVKYMAGGMASLTPLINSFVHVLMYFYYFLSSVSGPKVRKILNKWKMWLTIIQMVQFTVLFFHALQALHPNCPQPKVMVSIYIPALLMVYYLFWDFFKNTYKKKGNKN